MKKSNPTIKAQILRSAFYVLLVVGVCAIPFALAQRSFNDRPTSAPPSKQTQRTFTFADRVAYQRAIEDVYWRHRIWPKENAKPKPLLDEVMSAEQIEKKVEDYLRDSRALEAYWHKPIASEQLQAEMERMARNTKQPEVLLELFEALGNDPFVIAECLARPVLTERFANGDPVATAVVATPLRGVAQNVPQARGYSERQEAQVPVTMAAVSNANYTLPVIASPSGSCTDDTWTATSTTNAPLRRWLHKAVWTGTEMIVWGGYFYDVAPHWSNTGGRYNPSTDSWTATNLINAPDGRQGHTALWTGAEMIVWGGAYRDFSGLHFANTGGRYNPGTNTWTNTSTTNTPDARAGHTAVWSGSEMIVWAGEYYDDIGYHYLNTGGRYNYSTDSWAPTSTINAPSIRAGHTAVWTGSEMIVWGGYDQMNDFRSGGRYNPSTDSWTATSTTNAPDGRENHTAVWTSGEMIVWGGNSYSFDYNTGGRYNPGTDSWIATSTTNAPDSRWGHTAVWTGSRMIVWGGNFFGGFDTGGQYCAQSGPRPTPSPRARPTPAPRP